MIKASSSVLHLVQNDNAIEQSKTNNPECEIKQKQRRDYYFRYRSFTNLQTTFTNISFSEETAAKTKNDSDKHFSQNVRKYSLPQEEYKKNKNEQKIDKRNFLLERILSERKNAASAILRFLKRVNLISKAKRDIFINFILKERQKAALLIQKKFRAFSAKRDIKDILTLEANDYIFFYNYEDKYISAGHRNQIKINLPKKNENLYLNYCKSLKTHYAILKNMKLMKKHLKINFLVNDKVIIDPRFQVECENGNFYNILESHLLIRGKQKHIHASPNNCNKIWEKIFEISSEKDSNSVSDFSVSDQPDIDKVLHRVVKFAHSKFKKQTKPVKSILRNQNTKPPKKKVSFSDKEYIFHYN
jgi:hypothetical protein